MFLLGPSMVYAFGICQIVSFKLRLSTALPTKRKVQDILEQAMSFGANAKLAELFFESIPQYLTQLLMTGAKGDGGAKGLT